MDDVDYVYCDRRTMAKRLTIHPNTLSKWQKEGCPGWQKVGRRILFDVNPEAIKAWAIERSQANGKHQH